MPFISVKMLEGRSKEQKQRLVKAITNDLVEICGAPQDGTMVVIEEVSRDHWSIGGELVSER